MSYFYHSPNHVHIKGVPENFPKGTLLTKYIPRYLICNQSNYNYVKDGLTLKMITKSL